MSMSSDELREHLMQLPPHDRIQLAYEMLEGLSGERVARVSTAGGGSRGKTWLTIRANVLRKPIVRMRHPEAAVGAAILAASGTLYDGLGEAAAAMTEVEREFAPDSLAAAYDSGGRA
jgi:sugar (pentulose or hexulose) kinase